MPKIPRHGRSDTRSRVTHDALQVRNEKRSLARPRRIEPLRCPPRSVSRDPGFAPEGFRCAGPLGIRKRMIVCRPRVLIGLHCTGRGRCADVSTGNRSVPCMRRHCQYNRLTRFPATSACASRHKDTWITAYADGSVNKVCLQFLRWGVITFGNRPLMRMDARS